MPGSDTPEIIAALVDAVDRLGLSAVIVIGVVLAIIVAVYKGRIVGTSAKDALAEAVTPVTCMWSDTHRAALFEVIDRLERVERDLAVLKDRR